MPKHPAILLIDNDPVFAASLATLLESSSGVPVTLAGSVADAERILAEPGVSFEAILLETVFPGEDGIAFCGRLRGSDHAIPIILLSGADDESLLVRGFQAGADDFLRKPFRGTELLARLQARMRAFAASRDATITIGRLVFHPSKRTLIDAGSNRRTQLSDKEARLLSSLYHSRGDVLSRVTLLGAIWGYSRTATTHTVETHIYRLRQKIEDDPAWPKIVITERGGYRLAMPGRDAAAAVTFPVRQSGGLTRQVVQV